MTTTASGLDEIVDDATRREFIAMLGAVGFLAACGSDAAEESTVDALETRLFAADNGDIEIPVEPQRVIAAIGSFETDMVAVGVMPVLTTTFAGPWVELDPSVTITENIPPTTEEIAVARPDLIVGWNWVTQEASYDEISAIAPYVGLGETLESAGPGFDYSEPFRSWDTLFLSLADAVGQRARGEELLAAFDERLDSFASRTPARAAGESIARIEFFETGTFSYRGQIEDTAELMRRMGLEVFGPDDSSSEESLERLPEITADWLIVGVGGDMDEAVYEEVRQSALYQAIPAVQAGREIIVDGTLWAGFGHLWARAIVDDVERLFFAE